MSLIFCCDYIVLMTSYNITGFCSLLEEMKFTNIMGSELREESCYFSKDFERQEMGHFFLESRCCFPSKGEMIY